MDGHGEERRLTTQPPFIVPDTRARPHRHGTPARDRPSLPCRTTPILAE